ncbi:TetR/AcrR family transcriptional regulator [Geodermatophilus sp. CPCC 206100]|uniref:TetR/AcrR family transcriptional regulator n=1 Tax=Geodermatophilus sp. CPCC 206100 TaxID=3020054 RepID=UPI003B002F12
MDLDRDTAVPGRGRPRDRTLDERILEQALALLGSQGYAAMTLDELAARSGVAKTTVLRRWPSKAAVAAAAVQRLALQSVDVPDSGSLRGDLHALLHGAVDTFARGRGQFVPRLLRESGHHPEITELLFTVIHTRRQAYRRTLAQAIARGELAPSVDQDLIIDLLIGPIWTRLLITREPITAEYVDSIVRAVLTAFDVESAAEASAVES